MSLSQQEQTLMALQFKRCIFLLCLLLFAAISLVKCNSDNSFQQRTENNRNSMTEVHAFIVPHSHCDPGWIETVQTYFDHNVTNILTKTLTLIANDPKKRFIWAGQ